MLPLATPTILAELESVKDLVEKWVEKVSEGVPGVDTPMTGMAASGDRLDLWLNELIGELRLVSGKSHNLAEILASTLLE
jgi:hypothetical protein